MKTSIMISATSKCNAARRSRFWLAHRALPLCLSFLVSACDVVSGFQSAGDTLFPEESTHLNAPGLRLVRGGYRELRFASGSELYLLARSPEDEQSSLFAMRYSNPRPCTIPGVGRYTASFEPTRSAALIAHFADFGRQGVLRFADTTCKSYDFQVEDANLPLVEIPKGFVVRAGSELLLVDPGVPRRDVLAQAVEQVIRDAFAGRHVVRSAGRLHVLARDWTSVGMFGEQVRGFGRIRQSLVFEDQDGIHRLDPSSADPNGVERTSVAESACDLGIRSDGWLTYKAPCDDPKLYAYHERLRKSFLLDLEADSRYLLLQAPKGSLGEDPNRDPFWFFYLRDVDSATGYGTLVFRTPDGVEHEIGGGATLSNLELVESGEVVFGYALVNIVGDIGTLVWWRPDGTVRELARNVLRDGRRLIIDFDGTSGNLAIVSGERLEVIAERVPREGFEYPDEQGRWTALFHEFDGSRGQLSWMGGSLSSLTSIPETRPLPKVELERIAGGVPYFGAAWMNRVLPGILYFSEYDPERGVGTLEYRNLELRFTALLNYGISDFVVAQDEIIYSIPFGEAAGVWLVQGK